MLNDTYNLFGNGFCCQDKGYAKWVICCHRCDNETGANSDNGYTASKHFHVPAIFRSSWVPGAKTFYTLEVMGVRGKLHDKIYYAIHIEKIAGT